MPPVAGSSLARGADNTDYSSFTGVWGGSNQEVLGSGKRLDLGIALGTETGWGPVDDVYSLRA